MYVHARPCEGTDERSVWDQGGEPAHSDRRIGSGAHVEQGQRDKERDTHTHIHTKGVSTVYEAGWEPQFVGATPVRRVALHRLMKVRMDLDSIGLSLLSTSGRVLVCGRGDGALLVQMDLHGK